jgi:hypothetical protein
MGDRSTTGSSIILLPLPIPLPPLIPLEALVKTISMVLSLITG